MRQAGRYLPEFREITHNNKDFIKLCLNESLSSEITLQPLKRFALDAAIIFSDILMLPYGLGQKVEFIKNFGPKLEKINLNEISKVDEIDFMERLYHVYKAIKKVSLNPLLSKKNTSELRFVKLKWDGKALAKSATNGSSEMMTSISMSLVGMLINFQLMRIGGLDRVSQELSPKKVEQSDCQST